MSLSPRSLDEKCVIFPPVETGNGLHALLVQGLIEWELRRAMEQEGVAELPLYPEERICKRPTTEQVLRLFSLAQRHVLKRPGEVEVFEPELTELQRQLLRLLGVPPRAYRTAR